MITAVLVSGCQQQRATLDCLVNDLTANHYNVSYRKIADLTQSESSIKGKAPAKAAHYDLSTMTTSVNACSAVMVKKELKLAIQRQPWHQLKEINDYYSGKGKHITRYTQIIDDQLAESGHYIATDALPVPRDAANGQYKIQTSLILSDTRTGKDIRLGKAETRFSIL